MTAPNVTIRPELPRDRDAIREVLTSAFEGPAEARLFRALRDAGAIAPRLSLVAEIEEAIIGHILFTPAPIVTLNLEHRALCLAPMAVLPVHQRTGVGGALVRTGLNAARILRWPIVHVVGHPSYYARFGFVPASRAAIRCPFDVPDEAFMVRALGSHTLGNLAGTVRYHPAFADVS